jgi:hypothetical protein
MGEDPDTIRDEIADTRERMGDTIDALGYKADVKGRAKEGARRAAGVAQENPLGLAVGAAAAGFLAGMLIPSSRVEDEKLGPMADEVKQQARDTGRELAERAQETAGSISE